MSESRHNLNCTCHDCSGTGMSMLEQREFCNGNGQRKISAPDNLTTTATIEAIERQQLLRQNIRYSYFGNYPNK